MAVIWSRSDPELSLFEDEDDPGGRRLILRVGIEEEPAYVPLDQHTVGHVLDAVMEASAYIWRKAAGMS
jgi:hypothetical protein